MSITQFISGHLDLSEKEFDDHYKTKIKNAIMNNDSFIVGDAKGADSIAQQFLKSNNISQEKVTVYHMFDEPRNNFGNFKTKGGFKNDDERDSQMTVDSNNDILWVRSEEEQKKRLGKKYNKSYINGTTKNMLRRQTMS